MAETLTKTTTLTKPYDFDQVGSLLRTDALKDALTRHRAGEITDAEFLTIQQAEVKKIVELQHEHGLHAVTDGEFSRSWWHLDFLWNLTNVDKYDYEASYKFHGEHTRTDNVQITGKVSENPDHPFYAAFSYLQSILPAGSEAKQTIPSPSLLFRDNRSDRALEFYATWDEYLDDLAKTYHDTVLHFYELGARYIQFDDTTWAYLITKLNEFKDDAEARAPFEKIAQDSIRVINQAIADLPDDLTITTHICRGNFQSTFLFEGGYEVVAHYLSELNYDGFFLEYDNDRSGDLAPIATIWNNRENVKIVLGLITSKFPELEGRHLVKARIAEATNYVPLSNLALSTQCGFASTEEGNKLTDGEQWAKLDLARLIAKEVWED
ncbi:vitamin B12 independent methionine synthase [Periweissella cryptocerci]|uniref:Vitamin B12 independent methionine synthase n=1 Tax=Periweissella cryptocerci TaxID=2506420 RepID=A0A4P6YTP0_9LACO|nr:vitamin B12 independent methionine synthase [Periweissella cryptocerci]QBO36128.1 vitamin B12 independent methionine synthase [Periweissella cryptocerci]